MSPSGARRAPYKDFLQPALQRRFAGTAAILLGLAYAETLLVSSFKNWLWWWFPIGPAGLKALAIFTCVFPIIILRIAHAHLGIRTSSSPFNTFMRSLLAFSTFETVGTYVICAWFFSQIYILSSREGVGLHWIIHTPGRSRLNEQALFFTINLVLLGFFQGIVHLVFDQNRLLLGRVQAKRDDDAHAHADNAAAQAQWSAKIAEQAPVVLVRSGIHAIAVGAVNYFPVYNLVRTSAWRWAMWIFRFRYGDLPRYNFPVGSAPWSVWMLCRSILASFLLCLLWNVGDVVFRVQLAREPLKNGQPLTSESKDPNASLVNGLKSKKPRVAAFAMWELAFIARDYATRRQSIFEDIDRADGPMWSQISVICLDTIRSIERRIDAPEPAPAQPAASDTSALTQPRQRIAQPPKAGDVMAHRAEARASLVKASVANLITSPGKTPVDEWAPGVKKLAGKAADRILTENQRQAMQPGVVQSALESVWLRLLALPVVGPFFQQTYRRRLAQAALGSPYADLSVYANAAFALSELTVHSLNEDRYGNVQRDVPTIIRTLTAVIKKLEKLRDNFPTHWTDLSREKECPELSEVLTPLKDSLRAVGAHFSQYREELRLSRLDMRLAQEAALQA
ncbi:nucleoporin protein Ndc1-Nup [Xylariaceae sp. FL0594]|nr:nucleoporin protein Ndc1-Nup [Xylariaceae sp. FL0594]